MTHPRRVWNRPMTKRLTRSRSHLWFVCVTGLLCLVATTACNRTKYRLAADQNAYELIQEKTCPEWELPQWSVYSDPRSRYYDTYDVDCPPMPPDDPVSHMFMHEVNCMKGWPHWHDCGERQYLTNRQGSIFGRKWLADYLKLLADLEQTAGNSELATQLTQEAKAVLRTDRSLKAGF